MKSFGPQETPLAPRIREEDLGDRDGALAGRDVDDDADDIITRRGVIVVVVVVVVGGGDKVTCLAVAKLRARGLRREGEADDTITATDGVIGDTYIFSSLGGVADTIDGVKHNKGAEDEVLLPLPVSEEEGASGGGERAVEDKRDTLSVTDKGVVSVTFT